jgi:hypothetical protein
MLTLL